VQGDPVVRPFGEPRPAPPPPAASGGGLKFAPLGDRAMLASLGDQERHPPILPLRDRVYLASLTDQERHALGCELHQRAHWHDKQMCFRISVRKALRERESEARKAIEAELQQMLTMKVWHGVLLGDLKSDERKRILRVVVFLKDKFTASGVFDKFKARLCVNGITFVVFLFTLLRRAHCQLGPGLVRLLQCSQGWVATKMTQSMNNIYN
jgi:hypothetical protein